MKDTQAGFKLFTREAAFVVFRQQTILGWGFDMEILALAKRAGFTLHEAPIVWHDEAGSNVRVGSAAIQTLKELWSIRWRLWRGAYKTAAMENPDRSATHDKH